MSTDQYVNEFEDVDFTEGMGAEVAREESKNQGGSFGRRWVYLDQLIKGDVASKAQGKDRVYLRYATDYEARPEVGILGWLPMLTHKAVTTKDKPASWPKDHKWPARMPAVCRKDKRIAAKTGGVCWLDDNRLGDSFSNKGKPLRGSMQTYGIAILREPIIGDGGEETGGPGNKGKTIGFQDVLIEVPVLDEAGEMVKEEKDGKEEVVTEVVPQYVVVRQAFDNYWKDLENTARIHGTALDRDYLVIRDGDDEKTSYTHVAMNPMKYEAEGGEERDFNLLDPELREAMYPDLPSLTRIVSEQASMDYYNKWFIPQASDDEVGEQAPGAPSSASTPEPDKKATDALRERMRSRRPVKA